ncbi:hypothetical protein K1T71_007203 [Dendrolimus kikuchii]|uniref:Uncharacterized protein n=1 Tax=Dendrolimus kikuchii TaxID=765133 RepID=A0ACC1CZP3_9NEOP|nr:hypothetical protein K1T71_007203 [Dendrolimus kikuchii]
MFVLFLSVRAAYAIINKQRNIYFIFICGFGRNRYAVLKFNTYLRISENKTMSEVKKRRQYCAEYIKFGLIENPTNPSSPLCLLCLKIFSNEAMKPSRLQDHFNKMHPDKKHNNVVYFQDLEKKHNTQPSVAKLFSAAAKQDEDGLRASYNISLLIAQNSKPHNIREKLILPAIKEVIPTVLHKPAADIFRKITLNKNSMQRRIYEMAENIEGSLCNHLRTSQFSIQLDESTLLTNEALLLSYVRFIKDEKIWEELLLFARNLETDTKGEIIFNTLEKFCDEKKISLKNIISVATDGAPTMRGFFIFFYCRSSADRQTAHLMESGYHRL